MKSANDIVNNFLRDIQSTFLDRYKMVEIIRTAFFEENSELEEEIKYGGIVFNLAGELLGGIFVYKKHISIEFTNGAQFSDPNGLLEGKGKMRRHLKILDKSDLENKGINFYIAQAVSK